jgi:hypothetical protein
VRIVVVMVRVMAWQVVSLRLRARKVKRFGEEGWR